MSDAGKLEKAKTPKRFYFITALIYLPVFFSLTIIDAYWFGYLAAGLSFAMLLWMRHTKLWGGLRVVVCFAIAFVVALGGLYAARPQRNISLGGQIVRETVRLVRQLPADSGVRNGEGFDEISRWNPPDGYEMTYAKYENCKLEIYAPKGEAGRPAPKSDKAVLYLHGGAFVTGLNDLYRIFAERFSQMSGNGTVILVDYRLWPEHAFPAQQEDALSAWAYVTEVMGYAPENIFLAGDSAGGNLCLSLGLALRDGGKAMPRAIVCMSPWADLSNSGSSHKRNATIDPTFGVPEEEYDGQPVGVDAEYAAQLDVRDPRVSPALGDYAGFPPMLLQASDNEVLLSDSQLVADNATHHGVECTLSIYHGMFHVFQGSLNLIPESKEAWEEMAAFMASH